MQNRQVLTAILVVIATAGYWGYYRFGNAHLILESSPSGAVVRVDERRIGVTPLQTTLDAGHHLISLQHSYYEIYQEPVDIARGERLIRKLTLNEGTGKLVLLSNPKGAWVEVDGQRLAQPTPTQLTTKAGHRDITMGLPERVAVEESVVLRADAVLEVNLELRVDPHGSLTVSVRPRDALVSLPLTDVTYKPGVRLPIGEHLLRISRAGYETLEIRHQVRGDQSFVQVELKRAYGSLNVVANPADAELVVSYPGADNRQETRTYRAAMQVPVGPVEIRARAMGYRTEFKRIDLTAAGTSVRMTLSGISVRAGEIFRDELKSAGLAPEMVVLPAGSFVMGRSGGPPSVTPAREINITQPFALSVREVSVQEYLGYARITGESTDARLQDVDGAEPMRYVSWRQAQDYADWLTAQTGAKYRLPTEAEWEYAASAGTRTDYFFGDDPLQLCEYANLADRSTRKGYRDWLVVNCDDGFMKLAPTGALQPNPFGLHDIYGNVSEWVAECGMPDYAGAPLDGGRADDGQGCRTHGFRGGSWDSQPLELLSIHRSTAADANDDRGIRLLREL